MQKLRKAWKGGFQLRKWKINNKNVRETILQNQKCQGYEKNDKEENLKYGKETLQNSVPYIGKERSK